MKILKKISILFLALSMVCVPTFANQTKITLKIEDMSIALDLLEEELSFLNAAIDEMNTNQIISTQTASMLINRYGELQKALVQGNGGFLLNVDAVRQLIHTKIENANAMVDKGTVEVQDIIQDMFYDIKLNISAYYPEVMSINDPNILLAYLNMKQTELIKDFIKPTKFVINDKKSIINSININNTNLVELKSLCDSLDININYDSSTETIVGNKGNKSFKLTVRDENALINGNYITLDIAPIIYRGRIMVPVRVITEAIGKTITYDKNTDTIYIN